MSVLYLLSLSLRFDFYFPQSASLHSPSRPSSLLLQNLWGCVCCVATRSLFIDAATHKLKPAGGGGHRGWGARAWVVRPNCPRGVGAHIPDASRRDKGPEYAGAGRVTHTPCHTRYLSAIAPVRSANSPGRCSEGPVDRSGPPPAERETNPSRYPARGRSPGVGTTTRPARVKVPRTVRLS